MANNTISRFNAKNGLDNNSNSIINVANPVNNTDGTTLSFFSNASNLTSGTLNGSSGTITIQTTNYTTTGAAPTTSLALGVIAINSYDGNAWFVSNSGTPQVNQLLTAGSNFATTVSQTAYYRQTVISGPSDLVTSRPNYLINAGVGYIDFALNSNSIVVSFANGFGSNTDYQETINLDGSNLVIIPTSNIGQKQYIYTTYNASTSSVSYGVTAIPPEYGTKYPASSRARLQFTGTDDLLYSTGDGKTLLRDYYGNQWNKPGGKYSVNYQEGGFLGRRSAAFGVNGFGVGTSVLDCTDITSLGVGPWNIGFYIKFNATLPTSGVLWLVRADNGTYSSGSFGALFGLTFTATGVELTTTLSADGGTNGLANTVVSANQTSLFAPNQWIYFNLSFTGTSYQMGYAIPSVSSTMSWFTVTTSSAIICPITHLSFGNGIGSTAAVIPFQIYDFSFAPYSLYITGSSDTYGNSTNNIEGDYFNIPTMMMNSLNTTLGANLVTNTISSITSSVLSTPVPHNFVGGERVLFDSIGYNGYVIPTGLTAQTTYYVINPVATSTAAYIIGSTTYPAINTYTFQVSTTLSGAAVSISGTYTGGMTYTQSTVMEQNNQFINAYYNSLENSLWTKDVAHGLQTGDSVSFYTTTPGGLSSTSYYALPISENKFTLTTSSTSASPSVILNSVQSYPTPFATSTAFGNGIFVMVGNSGSALTSYNYSLDGLVWNTGTLVSGLWSQVIFCQPLTGSGFFYAMSDDGHSATSLDGINWTSVTIPSTNPIKGLTYDAAHNFIIYSSTTAYYASATAYNTVGTFTIYTTVIPSSASLASGYIGATWYNIAVTIGTSASTSWYSTNGTSWTAMALGTAQFWKKVAYGNGGFIVVGNQTSANTGVATTVAAYTILGTAWTALGVPSSNYLDLSYVNDFWTLYANTITVTMPLLPTGTQITHTPGQSGYVTWTSATTSTTNSTPLAYSVPFSAVYGNGVYLVANSSGTYLSHNYGVTWQNINPSLFGIQSVHTALNTTYGKGVYLRPGVQTTLSGTQSFYSYSRSFDGYTWESINLSGVSPTQVIGPSAYGLGRFVVIGTAVQTSLSTGVTNSAYSTDDGTTWTAGGALTSTNVWIGLYFNGINFVAWNQNNTAYSTSPTGVTWTAGTYPIIPLYAFYTPSLRSSNVNAGYQIVMSTSGAVSVNNGSGTWTSVSSLPAVPTTPSGNPGAKIAASDGTTVVVIYNGGFWYATLGVWTWTQVTSAYFAAPTGGGYSASIDYRDGLWVYASNNFINYSNNGITWSGNYASGAAITGTNASVKVSKGQATINWTEGTIIKQRNAPSGFGALGVTPTNSNFGTLEALPKSNLSQVLKVYLGEYNTTSSTLTTYSYRGVYISDWFPVYTYGTYPIAHNIGTGNVEVDIFFNEFKSDSAGLPVSCFQDYFSSVTYSYGYSYGAIAPSTDQNTVTIYTGGYNVTGPGFNAYGYISGVNMFDYAGPSFETTGVVAGLSAYYKVYAYRNW
jgi:hypothetical protein